MVSPAPPLAGRTQRWEEAPMVDRSPDPAGRPRVVLPVHEGPANDFPVFVAEAAPIFIGDHPDGVDAICGSCGTVVLAAVRGTQFVGVLFGCPTCRKMVAAYRVSGAPILGVPLQYQSERIPVENAPRPAGIRTVAGRLAVEANAREFGRRDPRTPPAPRDLTPALIEESALVVRDALGAAYDREKASDDRGRGRGTPPPNRNRIVDLVEYALHSARRAEAGEDFRWDAERVFTLMLIREHLERWREHPTYAALISELLPTNSTRHTIAMLMAAADYVDTGFGIEFIAGGTGASRADFWLYSGTSLRVGVEVKTPSMLWSPTTALSPADLRSKVGRLVKKAITQLDRTSPSMVLLAGFDLTPSNWAVLREATAQATRDVVRRPNFLATTLMNVHHTRFPEGVMAPSADMHIVRNPLAPDEMYPEPSDEPPVIPPQAIEVPSYATRKR
jgi:hypothetical protein